MVKEQKSDLKVVRLMLVDDQPSVRMGLRMRFALERDIVVVGEAGDGESALKMALHLLPDVVLMDVIMPGPDGLSTTSRLRDLLPRCAVIILTMHDTAEIRRRARRAGAYTVVGKQQADAALLDAIRFAANIRGSSEGRGGKP